ncbi:MAG: ATP-dependent Clp protease ATP-binding subunit [Clostridia bacterium]|nr:ATP-dependent Clp protease ATP-binding subunit [Clostridia bacterium]
MRIQVCARCKKRPASVYITRLDGGNSVNEGLCFQCAAELGIKPPPVVDMLKKMGIDEDAIQGMNEEINGLMENALVESESDDGSDTGKVPTLNLGELFGLPMKGQPDKGAGQQKKRPDGKKEDPAKKLLSTYCTNLNEKAAEGKIDRIVGRDREIDRMIQILSRRQKNNPCLIGEPGVGKTAIVEALALRIVEKKVPETLADFEVWQLDLTALVAGTQFRGQFESRILGLLKEIKAAGNIILMIDEVHNIAGAGETSDGSMSAANLLKPALSRGEIRVIGATTLKEYRKCIEKDSALERRFQPVKIEESSVDDTVDIIKGIKKYYEGFHGVYISDEVARLAATLSERYITDRFLPDKAIDLIDEAAAKAALMCPELNEKRRNDKRLYEIDKRTGELESKVESPEGQTEENYKELADLKSEKMRLEARQSEIIPVVNNLALTPDDLLRVIEIWTGIPAAELSVGELSDLAGLYDRLTKQVVGQDEAVSAVVRAIKRKRAGVSYRQNPVSMIFAGPTGVGKTELVKVLSRDLFKQPEALIRLDMSEFMEKHSVSRIVGAPPGYVGYDEAGQLTEKIRRRPYSVVLFDEIEKAHPDVMNILLQVLDDGKITDAQGRQVNFENTVIIMTTNAGSETSSAISGFSEKREMLKKDKTEKALSTFLRPEFINRIDEIITFRHLDKDDFVKIADIMLGRLRDHLEEKGIKLLYNDEVLSYIATESYSEKYGARNMRRYIERHIEDKLAEVILANYHSHIKGISLSVKDCDIVVDYI